MGSRYVCCIIPRAYNSAWHWDIVSNRRMSECTGRRGLPLHGRLACVYPRAPSLACFSVDAVCSVNKSLLRAQSPGNPCT